MNQIQTVLIVGAAIFGVSAILTSIIFIYFVAKGHLLINNLKKTGAIKDIHHIHWLNSIWIYLCLTTSFLLLTLLYASNSVGFGFMVKPNLHIIQWARWIILSLVTLIYNGCLAFIMTDEQQTYNRKPTPYLRAQSFFIVFYSVIAFLALFFATISPTENAHIVWFVASIISFFISIILYFFPHNKFAIDNPDHPHDYILFTGNDNKKHDINKSQNSPHHIAAKSRYDIILTYRVLFILFIIGAYIINVIIWLLSRSNSIFDILHLKGEVIAYLVADFVLIVVFSFIIIVLTFYFRMKTLSLEHKDGSITYKNPSNLALSTLNKKSFSSSLSSSNAIINNNKKK